MLVLSATKYAHILKPMVLATSMMDYFVSPMYMIIAFSFLSESILSLGLCTGGRSFDLDLSISIVPAAIVALDAAFKVSLRSFRVLPS